jgi:S-methyl-5-thioribose-1-phosphate isomerase
MRAVYWKKGSLYILDQTALPLKVRWLRCSKVSEVCHAIKVLAVRGAPAIGVAAAYGMALSKRMKADAKSLKASRSTAVDLEHAVDFVLLEIRGGKSALDAAMIWDNTNTEKCKSISERGASLIKKGSTILTHCNTGFLATNEYGSALGAIKEAAKQGKKIHVIVDETRPRLQGWLTSWELLRAKIPHTMIVDSAAGFLMRTGKIDAVMVGADRIVKNGDFANKIGTCSLAMLAKECGVPFYVLAPMSSFDRKIANGNKIKIEIRDSSEILGKAFKKTKALNLAFDVTPSRYVTGYVNEFGVFRRIESLWKSTKE